MTTTKNPMPTQNPGNENPNRRQAEDTQGGRSKVQTGADVLPENDMTGDRVKQGDMQPDGRQRDKSAGPDRTAPSQRDTARNAADQGPDDGATEDAADTLATGRTPGR